jgi:hypothetical protein
VETGLIGVLVVKSDMKWIVFPVLLMAAGIAKGQGILERAQWDAVEGLYQLVGNTNMFIRFGDRDGELVARFLWDTATVEFLPESELVFLRKEEGRMGGCISDLEKMTRGG